MKRVRRVAIAVVAAVAVLAGVVALTAAAVSGDRHCESLPDARDPDRSHEVCGAFLDRYRAEETRAGLGLPVSDEGPITLESARPFGDRELTFSRGTIYLDRSTGRTSVGRWYAYTPVR